MPRRITQKIGLLFSSDKDLHRSLRNIIGFYPDNIALYKLAFRHSSAATQIKKGVKNSNERLEFLGDSVIGTIVAEYLFKKFPYKDEGFLTKMRSKMVSRAQHNKIALKMGLDQLIQSNNDRFGTTPSSINGDAYEALVGAIYLDKGFKAAQKFLLTRIINVYIDMDEVETKEVDFKSKFIEWAQKEKKQFVFDAVPDAASHFVIELTVDGRIVGKASHFSKKKAEQLAAENACKTLNL